VDFYSTDDPFTFPGDKDSPGPQLFLYRLIRLAANHNLPHDASTPLSYAAVKNLAAKLGINSVVQLSALFRDLGLGDLEIELGNDRITAARSALASSTTKPGINRGPCDLERGLIDGALGLVTGVPVATRETQCLTRGDEICRFEAVLDTSTGNPAFVPQLAETIEEFRSAMSKPIPARGHKQSNSGYSHETLRTWYLDLAVRELARAQRHGRRLTVMYVDLDDLGQINSVHGRSAGDQVIRAVGTALSRGCRSEDFLWHNGEDEFAILLAETGEDGANIVARRLTTEVLAAAEYVDVAAQISASIGFATFPIHAESIPELINTARSAVYLAKSRGKGRTQAAHQGQPEGQPAGSGKAGRQQAGEKGESPRRDAGEMGKRAQTGSSAAADAAVVPPLAETDDITARSTPVASVVIASSSPLLLTGMREVLKGASGLQIVSEVPDPRHLASVVADMRPDLIFADLEMAAYDEFAMITRLRQQNLPCKITVFTADIDQDVIKLAADFSIDGVILQESGGSEVLEALASIYQGRTVLPNEVQEAMIELNKNRRLLDELSEREIEVLRLVAEGKSNAQIASELYITVNTVRFHLANIYQKLSVSNRTEAANYFLRQDLTPDGQTRLL